MSGSRLRVLAVAARAGRVGCVLLQGGVPVIWIASETASGSDEAAAKKLRRWLTEFSPDILVTENSDTAKKKRGVQIPILKSLHAVGEDASVVSMLVRRSQPFRNAYLEAAEFARQFPEMEPWLPEKPPIWKNEPYNLVYFEALALARDAGQLVPDEDDHHAPDGT